MFDLDIHISLTLYFFEDVFWAVEWTEILQMNVCTVVLCSMLQELNSTEIIFHDSNKL